MRLESRSNEKYAFSKLKQSHLETLAGESTWFEPIDSKYSLLGVFEGTTLLEEQTKVLRSDGYQAMMARSITRFGAATTPLPAGVSKLQGPQAKRPKKGKASRKNEGEAWGDSNTLNAARALLGDLFPDAFKCGEQLTKITMDVSGEGPLVAYVQSDSRYCNSRKGYHQSNHAYFQITPANATMRCHDEDCQLAVTKKIPEESTHRDQIFTGYDLIPVALLNVTSTSIPSSWRELKSMPLSRKKFLVRIIRNSVARADREALNRSNPFFLQRLDRLFASLQT